jgi:quinol-cytochrome oxidoreductase complex cytochrome b subunit
MPTPRRNFFDHLHAATVRRQALHPLATLGLGIAALTCLGVLLTTGVTLLLYYVPDQEKAYEQILHIVTTLHYGGLVRNLHFLAANALLLLAVLHLSRVFLTGSYKGRRLNWCYGLGLLLLILLANFTGYILPWDQVSYWAIKVGSNMAAYFPLIGPDLKRFFLAGNEMGHDTLLRSFALHVGVIPLALLTLSSLHLWRLRKDGGLALPPVAAQDQLPARPWLYRAEAAVALLTLAALLGLAQMIQAPIFERANPLHPPNPAKAPWYFVGFQEMVSYSARFGGVIAPSLILGFLLLVPFLDRSPSPGGLWFHRDRRPYTLLFLAIALSQIAFIVIGQWWRGANWQLILPF